MSDSSSKHTADATFRLLPVRSSFAADVNFRRRWQRRADLPVDDHRLNCTIPIGVAVIHDNERQQADVLKRADEALDRAKAAGRNCIEVEPAEKPRHSVACPAVSRRLMLCT